MYLSYSTIHKAPHVKYCLQHLGYIKHKQLMKNVLNEIKS